MKIFREPGDLAIGLLPLKSEGRTIGLCHGVFDLVHPGHIQHFLAAKKQVDILVVSITADKFVNKGPGRPLFNEEIRLSTLAALECIDYVTISRDKTAQKILSTLQPSVYFKGADYRNAEDDPTGMINTERQVVKNYGGEIRFTDEFTSSSSRLINVLLNPLDNEIQNWVERFKNQFNIEDVENCLDKIGKLNVSLVGEVIVDQYTMVDALGKTGKDPILAFHLLDSDVYPGGILAIANNCSSWVNSVQVHSMVGKKDKLPAEVANKLNSKIELCLSHYDGPTIRKHRYIDVSTKSKVFETYDFNPELEALELHCEFRDQLSKLESSDLVLIADYGHGLMSSSVLDIAAKSRLHLAVNVQTNAGNRGFNTLSKYPKVDFFTANSRELQFELRSKNVNFSSVVPKLMGDLGASKAVLTLGAEGILIFDGGSQIKVPAFATKIVDKVGAGDSVFAISSLLSFTNCPPEIIGLVANIVAANEIAKVGHQTPLTLGDIKKQIRSLLG